MKRRAARISSIWLMMVFLLNMLSAVVAFAAPAILTSGGLNDAWTVPFASSERDMKGAENVITQNWTHDVSFESEIAAPFSLSDEQKKELAQAVDAVLEELNLWDATEHEKVCGIYDYICANVKYSYPSDTEDRGLKSTAYSALVLKEAICVGYSNLFCLLAEEVGLEALYVGGYAGFEGHAWNIVKIGDYYYCLDSTWDAPRYVDGEEYKWFLLGSENFYRDHTPEYRYTWDSFLEEYPISKTDYFPDIVDGVIATGLCTEQMSWKLDVDGALQISGSGQMDYSYIPWGTYKDNIFTVQIEEGVTNIGAGAFAGCTMLKEVALPNSLAKIGARAFSRCGRLVDIRIPDAVTHIDGYAFENCESLETISMPEQLTYIGEGAFYECRRLRNLAIPDTVTQIGEAAFYQCDFLTEIVLPSGISQIEDSLFEGCERLTKITIPDSITSIGSNAFFRCANLETITIPNSVTKIGEYAFQSCSRLARVELSGSISEIDRGTFWGCENLVTISIPKSVTVIGADAFRECVNLMVVKIPDQLISIGANAFWRCERLWHVLYAGTEEQWHTIAVDGSNNEYLTNAVRHTCVTGQEQVNPKDKTCSVCQDACIHIWTAATCTDPQICYMCLKTTGSALGHDYEATVTESTCVTKGFTTYYCSCGSQYLDSIVGAKGHDWMEENVCSTCGTIERIDGGYCGQGVRWEFTSDGVLRISGSGHMYNYWEYVYFGTPTPWVNYLEDIRAAIVEEGVYTIGSSAFSGCVNMVNISIANSVTAINHSAFYCCSSLIEIEFPETLEKMEMRYMFRDCSRLTSVVIPDCEIEYFLMVFDGCTNLRNFVLPEGITVIGEGSFRNCANLHSIVIPDGVITIEASAFQGCTSLTNATIPDSVTTIGDNAFSDCPRLWHVLYTGSEEQWNSIVMGSDSTAVISVMRHCHCDGDEIIDADEKICAICCARCEHVWKEATCIAPKVCLFCKITAGMPLPHSFVDGICMHCGELELTMGDVNGDGKVNARDARLLLRYIAGLVDAAEIELDAADFNGDGKINARDARAVLRFIAGLE